MPLQSGQGGMTVFVGEPGIGKTRLLAELVNVARSSGVPARVGTPSSLWPQGCDLLAMPTRGIAALFLDDLHLLPGGSAAALEELIAMTATRPVLLAMAYRRGRWRRRLARCSAAPRALLRWPDAMIKAGLSGEGYDSSSPLVPPTWAFTGFRFRRR